MYIESIDFTTVSFYPKFSISFLNISLGFEIYSAIIYMSGFEFFYSGQDI
jgi:hypothetical protein